MVLHLMENYLEIIEKAPLKKIATFLGITDSSISGIRKQFAKN